ncbi:hypothetical protein EWM64_g7718 [Hericium alpestre]|uniref:Glucose-methanol-choline oxidoreductase C-terminal domain-containing protein n=1 Tax=Hericium alpestre TaxID=135208 RepID=A0A4Y9ZN56_9AGAM|nr:hypothetical protein EWM64_g7718 [Hericium alpestre]
MGPRNSKTGVLNPDLTLKGAIGLRVCDASVVPNIPQSHPQGPWYAIAERLSDLIKEANQ